ncbi:hypothetical protein [Streptomyces hydrogenans]|uniref:hypothetical protein n=1 Tax=Streptomyces hydrogenans TaxID=1873719 RepID=UPI0034176979
MITNLMRRGLPALLLATLPLLPASLPATAAAPEPLPAAGAAEQVMATLYDAIDRLPIAAEHREGYDRRLYKHWNKGLDATDGGNPARRSSSPRPSKRPRSGTAAP